MKPLAVAFIACLALAGCGNYTSEDDRLANLECRSAPTYAQWSACIDHYNVRAAERRQVRDDAFDSALAASLLADYAAQPRRRSCDLIGGILVC